MCRSLAIKHVFRSFIVSGSLLIVLIEGVTANPVYYRNNAKVPLVASDDHTNQPPPA